VIWLDVLDLPLVYYMETSYHVNGDRQTVVPRRGDKQYAHGGVVPTKVFERSKKAYPMLRYAWTDAKAALETLAADDELLEQVQVTYTNPETGTDAENILGFYALMLRPGQTLRLPARSPAQVFHVIEGSVKAQITTSNFMMVAADTCGAPGYEAVTLVNLQQDKATFLFIADESPLHRKLGVYENRG
jgi:gentisate 1,2-dioxygenase